MKNVFLKRLFIIVIGALLFSACTEENVKPTEEAPSLKLDGKYDLVSLTSTVAVDLDRNGISSFDILAETDEAKNINRYFLELSTVVYNWETKYYDQIIDVWVPYTNVISDEQGEYLNSGYGFTKLLANYRYAEETNKVEVWNNLGEGEVLSVEVVDDSLIKVTFAQSYYTKDWVELTITGTYKRRTK
jgi:hypothetical protein